MDFVGERRQKNKKGGKVKMEIKTREVLELNELEELIKDGHKIVVGESEKLDIETERELQKSAQGEMKIGYRIESVTAEKIVVEREFL